MKTDLSRYNVYVDTYSFKSKIKAILHLYDSIVKDENILDQDCKGLLGKSFETVIQSFHQTALTSRSIAPRYNRTYLNVVVGRWVTNLPCSAKLTYPNKLLVNYLLGFGEFSPHSSSLGNGYLMIRLI